MDKSSRDFLWVIFGKMFAHYRQKVRKDLCSAVAKDFKVSNSFIRLVEVGYSGMSMRHLSNLVNFFECDLTQLSLLFTLLNADSADRLPLLDTDPFEKISILKKYTVGYDEKFLKKNDQEMESVTLLVLEWLQGIPKTADARLAKALRFYNVAQAAFKEG